MSPWRQICGRNTIRVNRISNPAVWQVLTGFASCRLMMMRMTLTCLCALLLSSCASRSVEPVNPLQIEGLLIENNTQMWLSAVRILVPATGNFVSCSTITPRTNCSTTFPEASYTGNPVEITWNQGGEMHSSGVFVIQLPAGLDNDKPARILVVISGPGLAGAVITQR